MTLAIAAACAFAQDAQEKKTSEEEQAPKAPQILTEVGYYTWGLDDNSHKFRQYASPPQGLVLKKLAWTSAMFDGMGWLHLTTPGEDDYTINARAIFLQGKLSLEANTQRNTFFDPTPIVIPQSARRTENARASYAFSPGLTAAIAYSKEKRDQSFDPPRDDRHDVSYFWNGSLAGEMAGGSGSIGYTERRYFDRTETLPDTKVRTWHGSYGREFGSKLSLNAGISRSNIYQEGLAQKATIDSVNFGGNFSLSDTTEIAFRFSDDRIELPYADNAWVKERINSTATLYHDFGNWRFQGSYGHREHERYRADESYVDVPRWDFYEGKLTGRLNDMFRLTLKAKQQSLRKGGIMFTEDSRSLYFDDKFSLSGKLDGGTEKLNGYVVYNYGFLENEKRDVKIRNYNWTAGATYQVKEGIEAFGEIAYDRSKVRSETLDLFTLGNFFPESKTVVLGVNWAWRPDTFLSLATTEFVTDNDNPLNLADGNVHFKTLNASVRHQAKNGNFYTLTISPWRYDDMMFDQMGYRATLLQLTASCRF